MKKLQEKLAKVQVEKLEERKEFTFYCGTQYYCGNPCHNHTPKCTHPGDGGNGTGGGN